LRLFDRAETLEPIPPIEPELARYEKQIRFGPFGADAQRRISQARCAIIGCGALGSVQATLLVRAGVGHVRLIDRDFVETSNLQRQVLFDERDVAENLPKAVASARHLGIVNSQVEIEARVEDINPGTIHSLCRGADVVLDGTDNFETRFLLNDWAVEQGVPWLYGGCVGAEGQCLTIVPGQTPCLRCLMSDGPPPPGTTATCDTAGIIAPVIGVIAAIQACEAIKLLSGNLAAINRKLTVVDLWTNAIRQLDLSALTELATCRCCRERRFDWLAGNRSSRSVVLCGRNSVQISAAEREPLSLEDLANRLMKLGHVQQNEFLLKFTADDCVLTVFSDGRAIVTGTSDLSKAKSLYARFIGT
jgi:adenylyltransferase/sulfurtransferase